MCGCSVLEVLVTLWSTWNLGIRQSVASSMKLQLHVQAEDHVRHEREEGDEEEHPSTLAVGNHVETVARDGPRRGDARDTGML